MCPVQVFLEHPYFVFYWLCRFKGQIFFAYKSYKCVRDEFYVKCLHSKPSTVQ